MANEQIKGVRGVEESEIVQALLEGRKQLLELSTRNRLLNVPTGNQAKLVHIVDELSSEVYRLLVSERKRFTFLPGADTDDAEADGALTLAQPDDQADLSASRHTDTKLQSTLSSQKLQSRLLSLFTDARAYIEDQGVNILYLALGRLTWYESDSSEVARSAPLLLIPVKLERASVAAKFYLEALDEDPSDNLTLNARLEEFGIRMPVVDFDEHFSPGEYFSNVERSVRGQKRWLVEADAMVLGFFSFSKFLMFRDLNPENWTGEASVELHPLIGSLLGSGFRAEPPFLPEGAHLDEVVPVGRLSHVLDADSSQAVAIEEVRSGRNLVIQGPPGTGKSQTIANLIATAVLDGKSVLFVAEKMAALDVVRRRLEQLELGPIAVELHSHKTSKKAFVEELRIALEAKSPVCPGMDQLLQKLERVRSQLNTHATILNTLVEPCSLTPFQVIGHLAKLQAEQTIVRAINLPRAVNWSPTEFKEYGFLLATVASGFVEVGPAAQNPWRGVQCERKSVFELNDVAVLIADTETALRAVRDCVNVVAATLEQSSPLHIEQFNHSLRIGDQLLSAPDVDTEAIANPVWQSEWAKLNALSLEIQNWQTKAAELQKHFSGSAFTVEVCEARQAIAAHGHSWLRFLKSSYRRAVTQLRGLMLNPGQLPSSQLERLQLLDQLIAAQQSRDIIEKADALAKSAFGRLWRGPDSDSTALLAICIWVDGLGQPKHSQIVRSLLAKGVAASPLRKQLDDARSALALLEQKWQSLSQLLVLNTSAAFAVSGYAEIPFVEWSNRLELWLSRNATLSAWIEHSCQCRQATSLGLSELLNLLEKGEIASAQMQMHYQIAYYRSLYDHMLSLHPLLKSFSGSTHTNCIKLFRELDQTRVLLARYEVLAEHNAGKPQMIGGVGEVGIVLAEIAKKRRHLSIRKLIGCAGSAIQSIKPVFMMSPLSVAQFLEPGKIQFDLVVFDEASQVLPVDALGAIARGQQLVVVGDSRQLPPTNFFSRIDALADEDPADDVPLSRAADMESILSLASARGLPAKMLRWHYRSRHSSLIAVSNHEFYANGLFIVPSPWRQHEDYGLKFHHVAEGRYSRGSKRQDNPIEATVVARAVMDHARRYPQLSLGVAAFSMSQRDAIIDALELLRREDPSSEPFFVGAHPHEPFFVKNLENVQGDERDVIFISVCYGFDASGFFSMNFGPLNKEGGERRLNVLISRAKLRCEVFTSITADHIDLSRTQSRGVAALKTFLKYAETGILSSTNSNTGRMPDSPFEEAVSQALKNKGYTVHAQVGVAGFYIDLAVVDPELPGRYLLGIECDGASYHSARSARERDRQRQNVLEDHGWNIHRIWSTDWFLRPADELQKVLSALNNARHGSSTANPAVQGTQPVQVKVTWQETAAETDLENLVPQYEEYTFTKAIGPKEKLPEVMKSVVSQIVLNEGPISTDELMNRVCRVFGQRRSNSFQENLNAAIRTLETAGRIQVEFDFLSIPGEPVPIRNRANVESVGLRRHENVAQAELQAAILLLLDRCHGINLDKAAPALVKMLGLMRTNAEFEQRVVEALKELADSRHITINEGKVSTLP